MAKGWESKSAEEQASEKQAAAEDKPAADKKGVSAAEATRLRARQSLEIQRERILDERTSSPHRRAALAAALADIESRLAVL